MKPSHTRRNQNRIRLRSEALEDRAVPATGIIQGMVFEDLNGNNAYDVSEPGLANRNVFIDTNANAVRDVGELSVVSGASGDYQFTGLAAGDYRVALEGTGGWMQTSPAPFPGPGLRGEVTQSFANANRSLYGLVWVGTELYAAEYGTSNLGIVHHMNPLTGAILGTFNVAGHQIAGLVHDGTDFWGTDLENNLLVRFDDTGSILQTISTGANTPLFVAWDGSSLLVARNDGNGTSVIEKRDPVSGAILGSIPAPQDDSRGLAFVNGRLWASYAEFNDLYELDLATGQVVSTLPLTSTAPSFNNAYFGLAFDGQSLWMSLDAGLSNGNVIGMDISAPSPVEVNLADGATISGVDFGSFQLGTASGNVFNDLNNNGVQNSGENGLAGWRIYNDLNGNAQYDPWENNTITDASGNFTVGNLRTGSHTLRLDGRAGWSLTNGAERTVNVTASGQNSAVANLGARQTGIGLVGPEILVNTTQAGIQYAAGQAWGGDPQRNVAVDAAGNMVVVWKGNGVGDADGIFMQRYDANGNQLGGETRVNVTTTGEQENPRLARASTTGQYAITWRDGATSSVKVRLFNASGVATTGEITVGSIYQVQSIAMDADGDFAILGYVGEAQLSIQRFNKLGQAQGSAIRHTTGWANIWGDLAMDANGNFVVTYSLASRKGQTTTYSVVAQRYSNTGKAQGSLITVYNGDGMMPTVAMNASGQFVVTFRDRTLNNQYYNQYYSMVYNANGSLRSTVLRTEGDIQSMSVAIEANGDYVIATHYNEIQLHRYTANGVLKEAPFRINTNIAGEQEHPSVAVTPNGGYVVAWSDVTRNFGEILTSEVRMQRVAPVAALTAANGEGSSSGTALKQSDLNAIISAAQKRLKLSRADLAVLRNLNFQITDLPGTMLGQSVGNTIYIDANAASHGWFIDRTPLSDSEFRLRGNQGEQGKMDLLSAVMHEMSHALGRSHSDHGLMAETLAAGTRSVQSRAVDHLFQELISMTLSKRKTMLV